MKIYILTDLEGATGVVDYDYGDLSKRRKNREYLISDVNAAIAGAFDAGASKVVVYDGHGKDSVLLENWIRLIIHFTDMMKNRSLPRPYRKGDRWSSLLLLDPVDVFEVLGFDRDLSDDLKETRSWFIKRLKRNCCDFNNLPEISFWSKKVRSISVKQIEKLAKLY